MAVSVDCFVCEDEMTAMGFLLFGPPSHVDERVTKLHLCLRHGQLVSRLLIVMRTFEDCDECDGDGRIESGQGSTAHINYCVPCRGLGIVDRNGRALDWLV